MVMLVACFICYSKEISVYKKGPACRGFARMRDFGILKFKLT